MNYFFSIFHEIIQVDKKLIIFSHNCYHLGKTVKENISIT